jgi:hypothetical protein
MIDWIGVVTNGLWITGAAIILAAFSYHYWQAEEASRSLSEQLGRPSFQLALWSGLFLAGLGLAGTSQATWEAIAWMVFTVLAAYQAFRHSPVVARLGKRESQGAPGE